MPAPVQVGTVSTSGRRVIVVEYEDVVPPSVASVSTFIMRYVYESALVKKH
jgi:hypothetical protein